MTVPLLEFPGRGPSPRELSALLETTLARLAAVQGQLDRMSRWVDVQQRLASRWPGRSWRQRLRGLLGFRLETLLQYRSRPLVVPARYVATTVPEPAPVLSIVTPSLNQGQFLERTLRSVLDQGYPRLEYVVQDGGSDDDTLALLERHGGRLRHWESCPDEGQGQAINLGFRHTTGEIMAYLNSDDVLLPGSLAFVARYFVEHPDVDVVYGHRVIIDEYDGEVGRWVLPPHDDDVLSWCDYVPQETLFWRRRAWERIGAALDESFQFALDWDLLLRFRDAGAKFARLPRFLGALRLHARQKTLLQLLTVGEVEMQRLRKRVHGRYVTSEEIRRGARSYMLRHALCDRLYALGLLRY